MISCEKLDTEYMLYEPDCLPSSLLETKKVAQLFIDDMDESIISAAAAIKENIKDAQIARIKNTFLEMIGYQGEDIEQYFVDSEIVIRCSKLATRYKDYFLKMQNICNEENYAEMCKLAFFTYKNFADNYQYLESLRDSIKFAEDGITYYGVGEDSQAVFKTFFENIINGMSEEKVYRKEEY